MSSQTPPPPPAGPPAGPPMGPPPAGPPGSGRGKLPYVVGGGLVLLIAVVVVLVVTLTGSKAAQDARSVQDVADIALDAAQDLDIEAGIDLLCEGPSGEDRDELEELIDDAQRESGTDDPSVDYEVSDVEGDATGSFRVRVTSDEDGLQDRELGLVVLVETKGDRSCIAGLDESQSELG